MSELAERWKQAARTLFEKRERRFVVFETENYDHEQLNIHAEKDDEATLITSYLDGDMHAPVLDLDYEAILRPSSTEGHYHLFLEKEVMWDDYVELLRAMAKCGLIEQGYADASIAKGYSGVRIRDKSEDPKRRKGEWVLPNGYSVPATVRDDAPPITERPVGRVVGRRLIEAGTGQRWEVERVFDPGEPVLDQIPNEGLGGIPDRIEMPNEGLNPETVWRVVEPTEADMRALDEAIARHRQLRVERNARERAMVNEMTRAMGERIANNGRRIARRAVR